VKLAPDPGGHVRDEVAFLSGEEVGVLVPGNMRQPVSWFKGLCLPVILGSIFVLMRLVSMPDSLSEHMGSVEQHYAFLASQGRHDVLYPLRTLPAGLMMMLGLDSWAALRFPQLVLIIPTLWGVGKAAEAWGYEGKWAMLAVLATPSVWTWYGRLMPDAWLTTGLALAVAGALSSTMRRGKAVWVLGVLVAVLSKPLGLVAFLSWFLAPRQERKLLLAPGFLLVAWYALNWERFLEAGEYVGNRFTGGHEPFEAGVQVLLLVLLTGAAPGALLGLRRHPAVVPGLLLVGYALVDPWVNHAYYALPGLVLLGVPAAGMSARARWWLLGAVVTVPFSLWATGDLAL